nr:MAG TPA: hypothetical protein [Caudoviricetes sp.]
MHLQVVCRSNTDDFQDGIPKSCMKYFNEFPIYLSYIMQYDIHIQDNKHINKEKNICMK